MTISYEDMENFLVCPRRYYLSKKFQKRFLRIFRRS
ncbi:putative RecB family nuclease [Thermotoga sp. TBGT1765]|nr:RecB family nuclease, putative [Thermotoga sp. Cell2]KHC90631.1 putative RecB family nuclease [Thermotoga sp. TBGT1765]KHC90980.1 putative RecB family nuclease [Thermotoga sp. TBGT1766]KHC96827.1 putative RecB family nuclease [Thermotoga sp. Xyl54]